MSESDLVLALSARNAVETPLLPVGTIAWGQKQSRSYVMIYRPPRLGKFEYADAASSNTDAPAKEVTLAWPGHIFILHMMGSAPTGSSLWFVKKPPSDIVAGALAMYAPPLPNQYANDGTMCMGPEYDAVVTTGAAKGLQWIADKTIDYVYKSRFNHDLGGGIGRFLPVEMLPPGTHRTDVTRIRDVIDLWHDWTTRHSEDWKELISLLSWEAPVTIAEVRRRLL